MKWLLIIAAIYESVVGVAEVLDFSQAIVNGSGGETVDSIASLPGLGSLLATGQLNVVAGIIDIGAGLALLIIGLRL